MGKKTQGSDRHEFEERFMGQIDVTNISTIAHLGQGPTNFHCVILHALELLVLRTCGFFQEPTESADLRDSG